jgi:hypothetical protein
MLLLTSFVWRTTWVSVSDKEACLQPEYIYIYTREKTAFVLLARQKGSAG